MTNAGRWLRGLREELHLTRSAVERLTTATANRTGNERYRVRRGRLTEIEEGRAVPDIFEVESFCECYKVTYPAVLEAFATKPDDAVRVSAQSGTTSKEWLFEDVGRPFSLKFQSNVSFAATRLVTESADELGVPAIVRQRLSSNDFRLGIVGANDDTMGELVPAGSIVVIDRSLNTVEAGDWKSLRERPVYFVWHENGYSCSWCHVVRDTLFVVPYPTSQQPVMIFKMPRAATVIGRVVHIWSPLLAQQKLAG
jgi:hypothetical protein